MTFLHSLRPVPPDRRRPQRARRSEAGFTLIEVLVSALLVGLLASAAAGALVVTSHFSGDQRLRSQADQLATQDQERLRGLSDEQLTGLNQNRSVVVNGSTFTVNSMATATDTTGNSGCAATAAAYYQITSTVSWTEQGGSVPASISERSLLSRPVGGDLRVQVTDQTGSAPAGLTVTAAGASTQTASPDSSGCILFAGLAPGSYNVTLTDPGYVTPSGTQSPVSAPATVTATGVGQPTGNPFNMGLGGSFAATLTASGGTAEANTISWSGSEPQKAPETGVVATTVPVSTNTSMITGGTTGLLYPFNESTPSTPSYTNNYALWGGQCAAQAPPAPTDEFTVSPGATNQAVNVAEPLLNVGVTYGGSPVKPSVVKLTFNDGAGCSYSWTPTLSGATTLPANGWLANPGQPYAPAGDLTVCAQYPVTTTTTSRNGKKTTTTTNYMASVATGNTSFTSSNAVTVPITTTTGAC